MLFQQITSLQCRYSISLPRLSAALKYSLYKCLFFWVHRKALKQPCMVYNNQCSLGTKKANNRPKTLELQHAVAVGTEGVAHAIVVYNPWYCISTEESFAMRNYNCPRIPLAFRPQICKISCKFPRSRNFKKFLRMRKQCVSY